MLEDSEDQTHAACTNLILRVKASKLTFMFTVLDRERCTTHCLYFTILKVSYSFIKKKLGKATKSRTRKTCNEFWRTYTWRSTMMLS